MIYGYASLDVVPTTVLKTKLKALREGNLLPARRRAIQNILLEREEAIPDCEVCNQPLSDFVDMGSGDTQYECRTDDCPRKEVSFSTL